MFGGGGGGGMDFDQFFGGGTGSGPRGRAQARGGASLQTGVRLSFMEAAKGCVKTISVTRDVSCSSCDGTGAANGQVDVQLCSMCNGVGVVSQQSGFMVVQRTCPKCGGAGQEIRNPCGSCSGSGLMRSTEDVDVDIPPGVDNGITLQLSGRGSMAPNNQGPSGNLLVNVSVAPHSVFSREREKMFSSIVIFRSRQHFWAAPPRYPR